MLTKSPLYRKWMEEERRATRQDAIVTVLEARFETVPEELSARVRTVTDLDKLQKGIALAGRCASLDDFRTRFARLSSEG